MSIETVKSGVEKKHDVVLQADEFHKDMQVGQYIEVSYYKLDFTDNEFHLTERAPRSSFRMYIDRFSCEWSDEEYATNAIGENGKDGMETVVSSDGTVSFDGYVSAVWYDIEIL